MTYDVVVAGAGPVGLMVACELALRGTTVLVVERLSEPDLTIKAGSITVPTAEAFGRRGMLPDLRAAQERALTKMREFVRSQMPPGTPPPTMTAPRPMGHFGGIWIGADEVDRQDPLFAGLGDAATLTMVAQPEIESMLTERATALGVEIRRGVAVLGLDETADSVRVWLDTGAVEGRWLVGADGGRSVVRKAAGFDFPGTDPQITGHQALVRMTGAEALRPGWNVTDTGVYVHGPMPGRILTVEFDGPPADRDAAIDAAELQASLRHVSGVDVTVQEVFTATRFTDNARQAGTYRRGRVLLAGDAAHVHSPFGGQGLNLGLGDAMNLGWKLAAELQGWAPAGLLDSYTAERHPIGAWVLDWSRAQVLLMRPEAYPRALRHIVEDMMRSTDGATYMATSIAGLRQRYDLGDDDPMVGRSAPDLRLDDGTRIGEHLHDGSGVLIDPTGTIAANGYEGRLHVIKSGCGDRAGLLVRPDGIVAWAGAEGTLLSALSRWFG
jgi:2-polyprenyl-6-methoxyphenol hydroxylase-like FAD-dependent oxidoreductase